MRQRIPLGGQSADLNSRLSRQELINGYIESNNDGSFKRLVRTGGLTEKIKIGSGVVRGIAATREFLYAAIGSELYRFDTDFNPVKLGDITSADTRG